MLKAKHSLRIRSKHDNSKIKYVGTYKKSKGYGEVYSYRNASSVDLKSKDINELKDKAKYFFVGNEEVLDNIDSTPVLTCSTERHNFIVQKNNVDVSISFDKTKYYNHICDDTKSNDYIIEIEALDGVENRSVLNEINIIVAQNFKELETNKQSKYERGFIKKQN